MSRTQQLAALVAAVLGASAESAGQNGDNGRAVLIAGPEGATNAPGSLAAPLDWTEVTRPVPTILTPAGPTDGDPRRGER